MSRLPDRVAQRAKLVGENRKQLRPALSMEASQYAYEPDEGPLTTQQVNAIRRLAGHSCPRVR
jgi:hypothetical protein